MYKGRILAITDAPFAHTGYGNQADKILKNLVVRGWDVYQIACNYYPTGSEIKNSEGYIIHDGIKCIENPDIVKGYDGLYPSKESVKAIYNRIDPDVIWTLNDFYRVAAYLELGEEFVNKWVHWLPIDNSVQDVLWPPLENKMKFFAFLTKFGENKELKNVPDIMYKTMIYHGISSTEFFPLDKFKVKAGHLLHDKFVVITVAKHQPRKMVYHTAHAVCRFLKKHKSAFWVCKADPHDTSMREYPEDEANLEKIVNDYGVKEQVMFVPMNLPVDQLNDLYNTGDVFISLTGGEGFNIPLAESMLAGTVPIVTGSTSGPELVPSDCGFLVKIEAKKKFVKTFNTPYDIADLTEAIKHLEFCYDDWKVGSPTLKSMSANGRAFAMRNFDLDKVVGDWEEVLNRVIRYNNPIVWHAYMGRGSGFASDSETLIPALEEIGYNIYVNDMNGGASPILDEHYKKLFEKYLDAKIKHDFKDNIQVICNTAETFDQISGNCKVGITCAESTKLREYIVEKLKSVQHTFTIGDFVRDVLVKSGANEPFVIPPAIDQKKFHYLERPPVGTRPFTFLHVGIIQPRKNVEQAIAGYATVFPDNGQTKFIVKSSDYGSIEELKNEYSGRKDIEFLYTKDTPFSSDDMLKLYGQADCYVNLSHGEGLGIPEMESMATGLPVIASNWDARKEFLDDEVGWMLKISFMDKAYSQFDDDNGHWAIYDMDHYRKTLKFVFEHQDMAREKGKKAADRMKNEFTPDKAARKLDELFMQLYSENKNKKKPKILKPNYNRTKNKVESMTGSAIIGRNPRTKKITSGDRILVSIPTKDRLSSLRRTFYSLMEQTTKGFDIMVVDDSKSDEVRNDGILHDQIEMLGKMGIGTYLVRGNCPNQAAAHNKMMKHALNNGYKLVFRCDDDVTLFPDALEKLFNEFLKDDKCDYAAMGGVILYPYFPLERQKVPENWKEIHEFDGTMDLCTLIAQVHVYPDDVPYRDDVEHLYSSYMYRPELMDEIGGFPAHLSSVAFREETIGLYELYLKGYKLKIVTKSYGYHWTEPQGGCRSVTGDMAKMLYNQDEKVFREQLNRLKEKYPTRQVL